MPTIGNSWIGQPPWVVGCMDVPRRVAHRAFVLGMVLKGIDGALEVLGGVALLLVTKSWLDRTAEWLARQEFGGASMQGLAMHAVHATHHLATGGQQFATAYLFAHGAVKLVLVAGLLRGVQWVFPLALVVLTGFTGYQLYRLSVRWSWLLAALTVIDVIVIALIGQEWRYSVSRRGRG